MFTLLAISDQDVWEWQRSDHSIDALIEHVGIQLPIMFDLTNAFIIRNGNDHVVATGWYEYGVTHKDRRFVCFGKVKECLVSGYYWDEGSADPPSRF